MNRSSLNQLLHVVSGAWLTGPIFGKELCVSSRQRRNYLLRFMYLVLLTAFVVLVWLTEVRHYLYYGSTAYRITRMSMAGRIIIVTVVWFQFCATQLVAIVMLSTSINEEIRRRTLGVLMTTPISSFQIVMGKLLSKLWQLLFLLAISLPLLVLVRVFGGVPWEFVIAALCITLTALLFVGTLTMFFSVYSRHAYGAILKTIVALGLLHALLPGLIFAALEDSFRDRDLISVLMYPNPYGTLTIVTEELFSPGRVRWPLSSWPWHCVVLLGLSAGVLLICVRVVRRAAMRQIAGETHAGARGDGGLVGRLRAGRGKRRALVRPPGSGTIRRVGASPVLWKELRGSVLRGKVLLVGLGAVVLLLITYGVCANEGALNDDETHVTYVVIFVILGILVTAVTSAASITVEKESRCWPLLAMTTLGAGQILLGKAAGVFRRCLPVWLLLAGHVALFVKVGYIHPVVCLHLAMLVTYLVVFLTGTGLYLSARFRRTTTAVVMNLALVVALWFVLPGVAALVAEAAGFDRSARARGARVAESCLVANPIAQAGAAAAAGSGERRASEHFTDLEYESPWGVWNVVEATKIMIGCMMGYCLAGMLFGWRAGVWLRRNVY